jgi:hypothetical protein
MLDSGRLLMAHEVGALVNHAASLSGKHTVRSVVQREREESAARCVHH